MTNVSSKDMCKKNFKSQVFAMRCRTGSTSSNAKLVDRHYIQNLVLNIT